MSGSIPSRVSDAARLAALSFSRNIAALDAMPADDGRPRYHSMIVSPAEGRAVYCRLIGALLGISGVSVPRLRSIKLKQRGDQAAAGGREAHGAAPDVRSGDEAEAVDEALREYWRGFPRNPINGGAS